MNYSYDIEIKKVNGGKKTAVTISHNGRVIGQRTSARVYKFALVTTGNQDYSLKQSKDGLVYETKQVAKYQAIVDDVPGAREKFITLDDKGRLASAQSQQWHRDWIANGDVAKWLEDCKQRVAMLTARIKILESGPQVEYQTPTVSSWHQERRNVPSMRPWQNFYDLVEITTE